eukprot:1649085-Ditylum_brightwellii.AAC.1
MAITNLYPLHTAALTKAKSMPRTMPTVAELYQQEDGRRQSMKKKEEENEEKRNNRTIYFVVGHS